MKLKFIIKGIVPILLIGVLVVSVKVQAQPADDDITIPVNSNVCRSAINKRFAKELRLYRTVLFGRKRAEDANIGEIRFNNEGEAYYKISDEQWLHVGNTEEDTDTVSNRYIDGPEFAEVDSIPYKDPDPDSDKLLGGMDLSANALPRRGIFETKRVLTSELVPYLAQAMRSFACRVDMVCEQANYSINYAKGDPDELIPVAVSGCIYAEMPPIKECLFSANDKGLQDYTDINKYCPRVSSALLARETEILKMLTEYDAAYRSLLQFAGVFDEFLLEYRWALGSSLRSAASIIGKLGQMPCFLSSCDDFPPDLDPDNPFPPPKP